MTTKSFLAIATLLVSNPILSQENPDKFDTGGLSSWNLSLSGGITGNVITNGNNQNLGTGYSYNIEASYTPENRIGFFGIYSSTTFNKEIAFLEKNMSYNEFIFGPRIYSNNKKLFIDAGIGYYDIDIVNNYYRSSESVGFNLGIGGKISFTDSYSLIMRARVHNVFVGSKPLIYYGINTGIEINNISKGLSSKSKKDHNVSVGLLAGRTQKYGNAINAFGTEITYDIGKVSLIANYLYSRNSTSNLNETYSTSSSTTRNNVSVGARFYIGESDLRIFGENLLGLYFTNISNQSNSSIYPENIFQSSRKNNYFGLNFGVGAEMKIWNNVSGMLKANVNSLFRSETYIGLFFGTKIDF